MLATEVVFAVVALLAVQGTLFVSAGDCELADQETCALKGRSPCVSEPNTCGPCLDGFSGAAGENNAPCVANKAPQIEATADGINIQVDAGQNIVLTVGGQTLSVTDLLQLRSDLAMLRSDYDTLVATSLATEAFVGNAVTTATSPLATSASVTTAITAAVEDLATETFVTTAVAGVDISDLSTLRSDYDALVATDLATKGFVTDAVSSATSPLATSDSVTTAIAAAVEGLATESFVTTAVAGVDISDLSTLRSDYDALVATDLATKVFVNDAVSSATSPLATSVSVATDIAAAVEGLATEAFVNTAVAGVDVSDQIADLASAADVAELAKGATKDSPAYSCMELNVLGFPEGIYWLKPEDTVFEAYCDMSEDGGGWMLTLGVRHEPDSPRRVVQGSLPLSPTSSFTYADLDTIGVDDVEFVKETRFFCTTSSHSRIVHFKSTAKSIANTVITGNTPGAMPFRSRTFKLAGHSGVIPSENTDAGFVHSKNFVEFPFYVGGQNHWGLGSDSYDRWECDDYVNNDDETTLHQVWARSNKDARGLTAANPLLDCKDIAGDEGYLSGRYWVTLIDGGTPQQVWCDQEADGGWMLIMAYNHEPDSGASSVKALPVSRDFGFSHYDLEAMSVPASWVQEVRFMCTSAAHTRKIHFISTHPDVLATAHDGNQRGSSGYLNQFTKLPDHSATIPGSNVNGGFQSVDAGFTEFPFYQGGKAHWGVDGSSNNRWECDDYPNSDDHRTHHAVFVRN